MLEGLNLFAAPQGTIFLEIKGVKNVRIPRLSRKSTGFLGSPEPFQEVNSLCRNYAAFAGSFLAFREVGATTFEALIELWWIFSVIF
jgi:hypothetical protein